MRYLPLLFLVACTSDRPKESGVYVDNSLVFQDRAELILQLNDRAEPTYLHPAVKELLMRGVTVTITIPHIDSDTTFSSITLYPPQKNK